jgi:DNA-nicking Smr family endonuclease
MKKPAATDTPADARLFQEAVGAVQPLPPHNRAPLQPPRRKAAIHSVAPLPAIPDTLSDRTGIPAASEFLHNGVARTTLRKLRSGGWPVENTLDLHGYRSAEARIKLQEFLHAAVTQSLRCVRVIHGKGWNSAGGAAVLPDLTRHWLAQYPKVLAYCEAPPAHGGSGAVLVLLKTN